MRKKLYIFVLGALVVAGMVTGGVLLHLKRLAELSNIAPPLQSPWALRVIKTTKHDLTSGFLVLATLHSRAEIVITPQISGVIRRLKAQEGHSVKKGDFLLEVDTRELGETLAALKASLLSAEENADFQDKELRRKEVLLKKGYATQETVDQLITAVRTANHKTIEISHQIKAFETKIAYGTIRSPVDGIVAAVMQENGDLSGPGNPVLRITANNGAKINVSVPQNVLERMVIGTPIELQHGSVTQTVTVSRIFPEIDTLSMGSAEADTDSIPFGLPSGAKVPGRVILDSAADALIVPITAVVFAANGKAGHVFKITQTEGDEGSILKKIDVLIVGRGLEGVSIAGAIGEGDLVAIAQQNELLKLRDGDSVLPESEYKVPKL